jgi:predicted metal-dependent phosphoesterase TrpH
MRIDMHVHTRGSFDCLSDPDTVIRRARDAGLDRICITDHDEIDVALMLRSAYPDFVVAGEEVKTAERVDIIGLFLQERIPGGSAARRTCEMIREQRGIVYVPHPFAGGKGGGGRILAEIEDLVDAVEGFNARIHSPALNQRAVDWAGARGLPVGAGSDAHTLQEIGRGWAEFPGAADTPAELLAGLRRGRIGGTLSSRLVHAASTWAKVRKGMGNR